jgi:hypothetical protein
MRITPHISLFTTGFKYTDFRLTTKFNKMQETNNLPQNPQFCQTAVMRMMAVAFAKWLRDNTVADGAPKLLFRPEMKRYTIEELYDLYTLIAE